MHFTSMAECKTAVYVCQQWTWTKSSIYFQSKMMIISNQKKLMVPHLIEVVQALEVTIFMVANNPRRTVVQRDPLHTQSLCKVDHPYVALVVFVMHDE